MSQAVSEAPAQGRGRALSRSRNFYLVPYLLWMLLFVFAPIVLIVYYSLFDVEGTFTFSNYAHFFTPVYMKMTFSSFWYAFLITAFSLLVGYPAAYLLTRTKHKQLWLLLIILPSWINLLLKTYAFIGLFGTYGAANALLQAIGIGRAADPVHGFQLRVRVGVYFHSVHDPADLQCARRAEPVAAGCLARSRRVGMDVVSAGRIPAHA